MQIDILSIIIDYNLHLIKNNSIVYRLVNKYISFKKMHIAGNTTLLM